MATAAGQGEKQARSHRQEGVPNPAVSPHSPRPRSPLPLPPRDQQGPLFLTSFKHEGGRRRVTNGTGSKAL